jgi:formylglycine-generating enzyme required for sulfatase activity
VGSIGRRGDGRFGHADLAGSVREMTRDVFVADYYSQVVSLKHDLINLAGDAEGFASPARGGAYLSPGDELRATRRPTTARHSSGSQLGVRCARDY